MWIVEEYHIEIEEYKYKEDTGRTGSDNRVDRQ